MSTAGGIAAVSAVLKDLLYNGLIDNDAGNVTNLVGDVTVTALPPDRIELPEIRSQLNLFLYMVTPNPGWRNAGLPSRDAEGALVSAPPLALDLYYLLSAYGMRDFHAEILLGYAMQLLHEMPVLTREAIRKAFGTSLVVSGSMTLPAELRDLATSGLADQVEMIKITPQNLSTEEMTKLWTSFLASYRPTVAYQVSVVLVETRSKGRSALPVRRGGVTGVPFAPPVIEQILSQPPAGGPFRADRPILVDSRVQLGGRRLRGETTRLIVGGAEVPAANVLEVRDTAILFTIPAGLLAGVHLVQVAHLIDVGDPPVPHRGVESEAAALVLAPRITPGVPVVTTGAGQPDTAPRAGRIPIALEPPVGREQRLTLFLNELLPVPPPRAPRAYRVDAPSRATPGAPAAVAALDLPFAGVLPGTYVVRVQIDGAESPLTVDAGGRYAAPQVTIG